MTRWIGWRWRGFTLVELLVVIGIMAVLIGLLLPSLRRAQEQAKALRCATQLRSLGQGMIIYANDNRGLLPGWSGWHTVGGDGTGDDHPGEGWTEQLAPYYVAPTSEAYNCPAFPDEYRINYFMAARYTYVDGRRNLRLSEIKLADRFVLSGDCTAPGLYPPAFGSGLGTDDCDKDDATQNGVPFGHEIGGLNMHLSGNNILFADGHVALLTRFDPQQMTFHPRRMASWQEVTPD